MKQPVHCLYGQQYTWFQSDNPDIPCGLPSHTPQHDYCTMQGTTTYPQADCLTVASIGLSRFIERYAHKILQYYEQALSLLREVGDRTGESTKLHNIGVVWVALGKRDKALEYLKQAIPLHWHHL